MKKFMIEFEIFNKKIRAVVEAETESMAKTKIIQRVASKIMFNKIHSEEIPLPPKDNFIDFFNNMIGNKR